MDSGIISSRYAKALFAYVKGIGKADAVYGQVRLILSAMGRIPQLRHTLCDPYTASLEQKLALLDTCVRPDTLEKSLADFLTLVKKNSREEYLRLMLLDFLEEYRAENRLVMVQLTGAVDGIDICTKVEHLIRQISDYTPIVNMKLDPSLIGGFVLESWGVRMDASVKGQLDRIKKELTVKSKRLI